jgi:peptidylprolyl isomerase
MKKIIALLVLTVFFVSCKESKKKGEIINMDDKNYAVFETLKGNFKLKFRSDKAPNTVKRIKELINSGFYNGIVFHRVVDGFVAQAGDPTGTGAGGSGQKINAEFNDLEFKKGIVGMARKADDVNSNDSQFFICLEDALFLNNQYTAFAELSEGMDVVLSIRQGDKINKASLQ